MWAKKGLQLRVENKDLGEALKIWYKSTLDPDVGEEREEEGAELVRSLIDFVVFFFFLFFFTIIFFFRRERKELSW